MSEADSNPADPLGGDPQEERIGELINEFFDRRERGESVTEEDFLAQHPEHADELRQHLGGLHLLGALGSGIDGRTMSKLVPPPKFKGSSAEHSIPEAAAPIPEIPGYQIQKLIGRGGMGLVYKAVQLSTKRVVALKVLLEGPFATETSRRRFEREIALAAQLRHPNIIPIYDSGTVDGRMFYAMEYVFGHALGDYFRAHSTDMRGKLQLLIKIFAAVNYAHQRGVIHRDLKPSNILVDGNGEPHILDFGLAKAGSLGDMTTSITAQIIGTPAYMSPEQATADPNSIDIRTDVYSLGIVLYEAICGKMPYETNVGIGRILHNIAHAEPVPPSKQNPKIDAELASITLKAIDKIKETRYQSVESFGEDLRRYLAGEPILAKPPTGIYLLKKVIYRNRTVVAASIGILLVASLGFWGIHKLKTVSTERERDRQELVQVRQQKEEAVKKLEETKSAPAADAGINALVENLKLAPEYAEALKLGLKPGATKEDRTAALAALTLKALNEVGGDGNASFKAPTLEQVNPPMSSPRPADDRQKEAAVKNNAQEVANALLKQLYEHALIAGQVQPPTSQSAAIAQTTQPTASQPTPVGVGNSTSSQPSATGS